MIIARGRHENAREFLLLGLSRENINRLVAGQPIVMRACTHGAGVPEGWTISIVFGESELELKKSLEKAGLITPDTHIKIDPRLK